MGATCDPSVIAVQGTYLLYYGGCCGTDPNHQTAIGVASSLDGGQTFQRLNGGRAIVSSAKASEGGAYGAGQPSVAYQPPFYYMVYTDVSSRAGPGNRLFVIRCHEPTFQDGRQEWNNGRFAPYDASTTTSSSFQSGASSDWIYSDAWHAFILAVDGTTEQSTTLTVWNDGRSEPLATLEVAGLWTEGPGLVHQLHGHALPSPDALNTVPVDIFLSVGTIGQPFSWMLAHSGEDWAWAAVNDSDVSPAVLYEGLLLDCAGLPLTLVIEGVRLQWELLAPALHITGAQVPISAQLFAQIPYGASVHKGATVLQAPRRPGAFLLDDNRLWPVGCLSAVSDNGSTVTEVSDEEWDKYPVAASLFCLHP